MTASNGYLFNFTSPSINSSYSILSLADKIKKSPSVFQYMIEAGKRGELGGIWTVNENYSFVSNVNTNTNITLNKKFGNWIYSDSGIEQRMPWIATSNTSADGAWLTTSSNYIIEWWGTLISNNINSLNAWLPVPWMCNSITSCVTPGTSGTIYTIPNSNAPGIIWYWVR